MIFAFQPYLCFVFLSKYKNDNNDKMEGTYYSEQHLQYKVTVHDQELPYFFKV